MRVGYVLGVTTSVFPPTESKSIFAAILTFLGWNQPYTYTQLSDAINAYLAGSTVSPGDWLWVHDNFLHMSMSHTDMLMAYYGARVSFGTDPTTGLQTITYTLYS